MEDLQKEWRPLALHYLGLIILVALGLVFCVVMLCTGCIFCCCRCAGRCGAREPPFEKKRDPCKRVTLSIFLSALVIAILFGVVCAFVTNEYLERGVRQLPSRLRGSLDDTQLYLDNVKIEVNTTLVQNFVQLKTAVNETMNGSGSILKNALAEVTKAGAISNLTTIVDRLIVINVTLSEMHNLTKELEESYSELNNNLHNQSQSLLNDCKNFTRCTNVLKNMTTNANFSMLPSVDGAVNILTSVLNSGLLAALHSGSNNLNHLQQQIEDKVHHSVVAVGQGMDKASDELLKISTKFSTVLEQLDFGRGHGSIDQMDSIVKEYARYRYYVDLAVCIILLLILLCFVGGLFCGFCGKAPDGIYGDDCCNRGTGASLLMAGVYLTFLLSSLLMLITIIHFLVGSLSQKMICQQVEDPTHSQLLKALSKWYIDDSVRNQKWDFDTDVLGVLDRCNHNYSLYDTLQPSSGFNITQVKHYIHNNGIEEKLMEMAHNITFNGSVQLITPEIREQLANLSSPDLSHMLFNNYTAVLHENITKSNLTVLSEMLWNIAKEAPEHLKNKLKNASRTVNELQSTLQTFVSNFQNLTDKLQQEMQYNHTYFGNAIQELLDMADHAEKNLPTDGTRILRELVKDFGEVVLFHLEWYANKSFHYLSSEMGRCGPLSLALNASVAGVCSDMLEPLNGFWVSAGWCLILFLPCLIMAVSAATLYRKSEPYSGALVDSEYLYDAYADRDNIPLANVHGKKGRRSYAERESYENQSGYVVEPGGPTSPSAFPSLRGGARGNLRLAHAERYGDMAPKNWDSPPGLPLHYAPPLLSSSEYERPPPYYYPGPGDLK